MSRHDAEAARLYARHVNIDSMCARLPDLGESLHNAAVDLSRDLSLERIDDFLSRLKGAETSVRHMRIACAGASSEPHK